MTDQLAGTALGTRASDQQAPAAAVIMEEGSHLQLSGCGPRIPDYIGLTICYDYWSTAKAGVTCSNKAAVDHTWPA